MLKLDLKRTKSVIFIRGIRIPFAYQKVRYSRQRTDVSLSRKQMRWNCIFGEKQEKYKQRNFLYHRKPCVSYDIKTNKLNAHVRNKAFCFSLPLKYTIILWNGCGEAALFLLIFVGGYRFFFWIKAVFHRGNTGNFFKYPVEILSILIADQKCNFSDGDVGIC